MATKETLRAFIKRFVFNTFLINIVSYLFLFFVLNTYFFNSYLLLSVSIYAALVLTIIQFKVYSD